MNNYMNDIDDYEDREFTNAVAYDEQGKIIYLQDLIMEEMLGRKLSISEIVLHKNGNSLDNRRANLYVVLVFENGDTALVISEKTFDS